MSDPDFRQRSSEAIRTFEALVLELAMATPWPPYVRMSVGRLSALGVPVSANVGNLPLHRWICREDHAAQRIDELWHEVTDETSAVLVAEVGRLVDQYGADHLAAGLESVRKARAGVDLLRIALDADRAGRHTEAEAIRRELGIEAQTIGWETWRDAADASPSGEYFALYDGTYAAALGDQGCHARLRDGSEVLLDEAPQGKWRPRRI